MSTAPNLFGLDAGKTVEISQYVRLPKGTLDMMASILYRVIIDQE